MIDLHSHTTASDGSLTPEELLDKAIKIKLKALAITDHDTVSGLERANNFVKDKSIELINGVEIEIDYPGKGEFHLLGLAIDYKNRDLLNSLEKLKVYREDRNLEMIESLNRKNINISYDEVKKEAKGKIIARPHFSRVLINKGYAKNQKEAFKKYLCVDSPFYVRKRAMGLEEAINVIHSAGGKAIVAHPLSLYISWGRLEDTLKAYKDLGLDGIEAWHSGNSRNDCFKLEKIASNLRLIVSGGSDYHGENIKGRELGFGAGNRPIPDIFLNNFKDK